MSTIFEIPEQSSSTEYSDELTTALAAGRWWAIMEVSDPISEENEFGDLISGQCWGTVEAGETSSPTSLVFSDASEKAQPSGFSDAPLKTTKQWRQKTMHGAPYSARFTQGAPMPARSERRGLNSPLAFSDASEKEQHSGFSDATLKTTDQRRKWRQKRPQIEPVPPVSPQEPPVPLGSKQRGKLRIPGHLIKHLQKASFETPMPAMSLRAPVAAPKVLACSPHGAPMPDKITDRQKLKIPEPLRRELLHQKPQAPSLKIEPVCHAEEAPIIEKISERRNIKNPELLEQTSQASSVQGALIPAKSKQDTTLPDSSPVHAGTQQAAVPARTAKRGTQRLDEHVRQHLQNAPVPVSSPQQAPMPSWSKRVCPWSTEASVNAGVDQSPPQKKPRIAIKVQDQQTDPDSIQQIDYLCSIFTKFCVISIR